MSALLIRDDIRSEELRRRARRERDGRVSARLIAIANALDGMDRASAARLAGMDRQTLRDWVHRDNAEGLAGLCDRPKPGRLPKLSEGQMASLKAIVLAGPDPAKHQVGRWRIVDLCQYVEERWAVSYSETGMLRLLWSPDLSHRKTRPRHPQSDEKAQQAFKKRFAACLNEIAAAHPEAQRFEIWSQGEAGSDKRGAPAMSGGSAAIPRAGGPISVTNRPGSSVPSVRRGHRVALVLTRLDTAAMNLFLAELSQAGAPGAHGVVLMDKAGWHTAGDLGVPENLSLVFLPPPVQARGRLYSPELNPIERLWLHLRDNRLSHRVFRTTEEIVDSCCAASNWLLGETGRIRSLCSYPWFTRVST